MNYNKIKDFCIKRGGISRDIIYAMHTTESFKFLKDEAAYLEKSRTLLRDELLNCYAFLEQYDLFEIYLDDRDGML